MTELQRFENSVLIQATATQVERCLTESDLMHRWLNPALRCESVGEWSTSVGSQMRFVMQVPLLWPTLLSTVAEREPGLVVWSFEGFFRGRDRWQCEPLEKSEDQPSRARPMTRLTNSFEFEIPNPLVAFGFNTFASSWTQADMQAQLRRLQQVAERL